MPPEQPQIPPETIERIQCIISELDAAVPREGAGIIITQYGGGPDESKMIGNRAGYLRLGIEMLKAGFAPPRPNTADVLDVDLKYLLSTDSEFGIDWLERQEELPAVVKRTETGTAALIGYCCLGIMIGIVVLGFIGFGTIISWLARLF